MGQSPDSQWHCNAIPEMLSVALWHDNKDSLFWSFFMTSPSDITKNRRKAREIRRGRTRKNKVNREGTTPELFKLDKPVAAKSPAK
jgi:hypothetical protein